MKPPGTATPERPNYRHSLANGRTPTPGDSNRERGVTNTQCHKAKLICSEDSPRSNRERGVTNTQCHKAKLIWSENSPRSYRERGVTNTQSHKAKLICGRRTHREATGQVPAHKRRACSSPTTGMFPLIAHYLTMRWRKTLMKGTKNTF